MNGPFTITFSFTEDVTGLELADIRVWNGTASSLQGSGATWTATITPSDSGLVVVNFKAGSVSDSTGNLNTGASPLERLADLDRPSATLTGPTSVQTGSFEVRVVFDEVVTGLSTTDFGVVKGAVTALTAVDSDAEGYGKTWTVAVKPSASGNVVVTLAANAASDQAGNGNPRTEVTVVADLDRPTATIQLPSLSPATAVNGPFTVTVAFNEPVTGLAAADFQVGNGKVSAVTPLSPSDGYAASWTATVTPVASGNVTMSDKRLCRGGSRRTRQ